MVFPAHIVVGYNMLQRFGLTPGRTTNPVQLALCCADSCRPLLPLLRVRPWFSTVLTSQYVAAFQTVDNTVGQIPVSGAMSSSLWLPDLQICEQDCAAYEERVERWECAWEQWKAAPEGVQAVVGRKICGEFPKEWLCLGEIPQPWRQQLLWSVGGQCQQRQWLVHWLMRAWTQLVMSVVAEVGQQVKRQQAQLWRARSVNEGGSDTRVSVVDLGRREAERSRRNERNKRRSEWLKSHIRRELCSEVKVNVVDEWRVQLDKGSVGQDLLRVM